MVAEALPRLEQQSLLLDEWVRTRKQIAALEAKAAGLLAARGVLMDADVADAPLHRETIWRSMIAEYSAAGRVAKGSMEHAFSEAHALHDDFPALRESFDAGRVSAAHVREIIRAAYAVNQAIQDGTVEAGTLAVYEAAAVEFAEAEAPARTRVHVREIAAALAGRSVAERHREAASERKVSVRSVGDGLALIQALVPEHQAVAIMDRLTQMARHQKAHPEEREPTLPPVEPVPDDAVTPDMLLGDAIFGVDDTFTTDPFQACWDAADRATAAGPQIIHIPPDTRTMDQLRADLLTDLLLAAEPTAAHGTGLSSITARIQVTIAATTLAGLDDNPAQLDGHGTLDPAAARTLAGRNGGWTRLFLNASGMVTQTDTYTPTAGMSRYLAARDQHCRFPGCRMPVHRCDIDHTVEYSRGGPTSLDNLAHLCRNHHALKHPDITDAHRWTVRQLPDWTLEWTSPNGRAHTDNAPRRVMFVPSSPPEAAEPSGHTARSKPSIWDDPPVDRDAPPSYPF